MDWMAVLFAGWNGGDEGLEMDGGALGLWLVLLTVLVFVRTKRSEARSAGTVASTDVQPGSERCERKSTTIGLVGWSSSVMG